MGNRIIVRTFANVSFAGRKSKSVCFFERGISLRPNDNLQMEVFIPENEIREIICNSVSMSYEEFEVMNEFNDV